MSIEICIISGLVEIFYFVFVFSSFDESNLGLVERLIIKTWKLCGENVGNEEPTKI